MTPLEILVVALIIDAVVGDPHWMWSRLSHPVAMMGAVVKSADDRFNAGLFRRAKGTAVMAALVVVSLALGTAVSYLHYASLIETIVVALLLAQNALARHVVDVGDALDRGLPEGRCAVALIVGRDTAEMPHDGVIRSAIESAAENLSDGVIAPAFWFLALGLPGILMYKIVNTADSMIGYRTEKHRQFGWAAARLDDILNWIPARLTALLIAPRIVLSRNLRYLAADARRHRSPNAGWPESAMARRLGIALSGPRVYDGKPSDDPFVNAGARKSLNTDDIRRCVRILWENWALWLGTLGAIAILWRF